MDLDFPIEPVLDLTSDKYDGVVFVSNACGEDSIPDIIKTTIKDAYAIDGFVHEIESVLEIKLPARRLIYSPTGHLNTDYHDVRSFGEAGHKGILRALKCGVKNPLVILVANVRFPKTELVTLLGVLEGLYSNIQHRELCPEEHPKVESLGVWMSDKLQLLVTISAARTFEIGRIVARDIGGADPERMSPPKVEQYVREIFPPVSKVDIKVIDDEEKLNTEYPLFSAVNRAAQTIERHKGRIIYLTYEGREVKETLIIIGKGVTYNTGGADIKTGGLMIGMSRDKCGAAAVAGFMKIVSLTKPPHLKVIGIMSMVRNSIGENCYVADEIIKARSGAKVRVTNTDAEGRMILADLLCHAKEISFSCKNPYLITIATLTAHALRSVGTGYSISIDNGPARLLSYSQKLQSAGNEVGDMIEISFVRREDYLTHKGVAEGEDIIQHQNKPVGKQIRGHQSPVAFMLMASGLDKYGIDSTRPMRYTHLDILPAAMNHPDPPTGSPVLALANRFLKII